MKTCGLCKRQRSATEFNKGQSRCRPCQKAYNKKRYREDAEFRQKNLARSKASCRKLRAAAIQTYGSRCACCGESELMFLAIDHTNSDGAAHRRETGHGSQFYQWLKNHGYPKIGFRVLCHNCNLALGFYGECPHQTS